MNIQSIAFLLIRLFAIYFLFITLGQLSSINYLLDSEYLVEIISGIINVIIPLFFTVILYKGAFRISEFLVQDTRIDNETELDFNYQIVANLLFAGIGLFIFVSESFYLIGRIHSYFYYKEMNSLMNPDQLEIILTQVIISAIKVIVSILLIIGSKKLSQSWIKFQNWH